jgi:predicted P-loop ATPase
VRVIDAHDRPAGWTLLSALSEGWTGHDLTDYARRDDSSHIRTIEPITPQTRPKPTHRAAAAQSSKMDLWRQLGLEILHNGQPVLNETNLARALTHHPQLAGQLWLNEFSQRLMWADHLCAESDLLEALLILQDEIGLSRATLPTLERAALLTGYRARRNPVRDYLDRLAWDGTERLHTLLADAWGTIQDDYHAAVGRSWLMSMVARVYQPGCQADYMPVLEGAQGTLKSSSVRALAPDWFVENLESPSRARKDFLGALQGHWLVEIPEFDVLVRREGGLDLVKGIFSIRTDTYRVPYGRTTVQYPRQCIFVGTANGSTWNTDATGARRWWPITCGDIHIAYLTAQRDQLFAEAAARCRRGESWWHVPKEAARDAQDERRAIDEWESQILRCLAYFRRRDTTGYIYEVPRTVPLTAITVRQFLAEWLLLPPEKWTLADQVRIGKCCTALGFQRRRGERPAREWYYVVPVVPKDSMGPEKNCHF